MNHPAIISHLATAHESFYLYDAAQIAANAQRLQRHMPSAHFLYSLKTNPNPHVVDCILAQGLGVDAASVNEVNIGVQHGLSKRNIQYSAPGKPLQAIADTITQATLIADSLGEVARIAQVASEKGICAEIGVRLNPNFTFDGQGGSPSKFGIDEDDFFAQLAAMRALPSLRIVGLHLHIRSQVLRQDLLVRYYQNVLALAERVQQALGTPLAFVNMGAGLGIPYEPTDTPLDLADFGSAAQGVMQAFAAQFPTTALYIETGRYLVGGAGIYATHVLDKKTSHGKTFVILANTLNGFIRPCLAQLVAQYQPEGTPAPSEPLYICKTPAQCHVLHESATQETVTLVGNLCTASDVVAKDVLLPTLAVGDVVAFTNAGSYAAVLSPMQFSSQTPPKELLLGVDGKIYGG